MTIQAIDQLRLLRRFSGVLFALLATAFASPLSADPPTVAYIFPAGGQRGTTVAFRVGGHNLHDPCPFEMLGDGVQASRELHFSPKTIWFEGPLLPLPESQRKEDYPRDLDGSVTIAADAPLGIRRWRVWNSQGATESMKFVVGDLPEMIETEIDGEPIPVEVAIPLTINGRIFPREDLDDWTFAGRGGTSYTCDLTAARLGSPLDARLEIFGPDGRSLAEATANGTSDCTLRFVAPADGVYRVRIHDVKFEGGQHFVYRLTITDGPLVESVFPLGGRRGEEVSLQLLGQSLPAEPAKIKLEGESGFGRRLEIAGRLTNPVALDLGEFAEAIEAEPNATRETASRVPLPAVANGRIDKPGDVDHWIFPAAKGDKVIAEIRATKFGSPLDSVIRLLGADGKQLAESDDAANGQPDSRLEFSIPTEGEYAISVSDRFAGRGGERFSYRLVVQRATDSPPDFSLRLAADALTLVRGGEAKLKIDVERRGGFAGPIELAVEPLPAGVTVAGTSIAAGKNDTTLVFKAADEAKIDVARLAIRGSAMIGEISESRLAHRPPDTLEDSGVDHLLLAVAIPTPFKVLGSFESKYAERGSTFLRRFTIDRGGFDGPIEIRMADRQARHLQGVTGPALTVPPGVSQFDYPIRLPPWMELGRTSRTCVMAVGTVTDRDGSQHKVSFTSQEQADQIIVLVDPGQLGVRVSPRSIRAVAGTTVPVQVRVDRGATLQLPVTVELIVADHIHGVHATPITLSPEESAATLQIEFAADDSGPFNLPLLVRATATRAGQPYSAEDRLEVAH